MIIFDQKKYVENVLLKNGISTSCTTKDIYMLSKYYLNQNKPHDEILKILRKYVNKVFPNGSLQEVINFTFKKAIELKSHSLENEIMYITKNEINTILNFTNKIKEQKIMFSMLVIYKFSGYDYYKFVKSDIFKYAKVKRNEDILYNLMCKMSKLDLLKTYIDKSNDDLDKLTFAEQQITNESEIAITIDKLDNNFIHHFTSYLNQKTSNCTNCGTLIEVKSNRQKFCDECWKEELKKIRVDINKRYYENNKKK